MKLTNSVFILFLLITLSACTSAKNIKELESLNAKNRDLESMSLVRQREIADEQKIAASLAEKSRALQAEIRFNDKFEKIRKTFTKKEANVYRQGNSLIISLKGLKFPSSQSNLKGENFTLLAKVQKAINEFDNSTVLVKGHADASGGNRFNTKVSKMRAQTVRDYFISNGIIGKDKIKAIGFKDDLPVATNKTNVGKAQNRRVDVVISL
ncbi:MAG: OmpA family protein [Bacteriovorax sp.]|nr:OmpA family protein [Bacteriovorax sp.]